MPWWHTVMIAGWNIVNSGRRNPLRSIQVERSWSGGQSSCASGTPSTSEYGTCWTTLGVGRADLGGCWSVIWLQICLRALYYGGVVGSIRAGCWVGKHGGHQVLSQCRLQVGMKHARVERLWRYSQMVTGAWYVDVMVVIIIVSVGISVGSTWLLGLWVLVQSLVMLGELIREAKRDWKLVMVCSSSHWMASRSTDWWQLWGMEDGVSLSVELFVIDIACDRAGCIWWWRFSKKVLRMVLAWRILHEKQRGPLVCSNHGDGEHHCWLLDALH